MTTLSKRTVHLEKLALAIRTATVPPVLVGALLVLLAFLEGEIFISPLDFPLSLFFLMAVPLLAYPLSYAIPKIRKSAREGQRQLALLCNLIGYAGAMAYGLIAHVSLPLMVIYLTYFISVVTLTLLNVVIRVRASGHACSIAGPLILLVYFIGWGSLIPCTLAATAIAWSSLYLKRHTPQELAMGSLAALAAFIISLVLAATVLG